MDDDPVFPGRRYLSPDYPSSMTVGDVNGDGHIDVLTANDWGPQFSTMLGAGDGTLGAPLSIGDTFTFPADIELLDWNADGELDAAVLNYGADAVDVYLGAGDGSFVVGPSIATGSAPEDAAVVGDPRRQRLRRPRRGELTR